MLPSDWSIVAHSNFLLVRTPGDSAEHRQESAGPDQLQTGGRETQHFPGLAQPGEQLRNRGGHGRGVEGCAEQVRRVQDLQSSGYNLQSIR